MHCFSEHWNYFFLIRIYFIYIYLHTIYILMGFLLLETFPNNKWFLSCSCMQLPANPDAIKLLRLLMRSRFNRHNLAIIAINYEINKTQTQARIFPSCKWVFMQIINSRHQLQHDQTEQAQINKNNKYKTA